MNFETTKELSWKAKGILNLLIKNERTFNRTELLEFAGDGVASTTKGVRELIEKGYIEYITERKVGHGAITRKYLKPTEKATE